jgi:hypothetical protein
MVTGTSLFIAVGSPLALLSPSVDITLRSAELGVDFIVNVSCEWMN